MSDLESTQEGGLFRLAFELAPAGMLAVDRDGRILLANRESERVFGYPSGGLIGVPIDHLVPERLRGGHASHRAGFFAAPESRQLGVGRELLGLRQDGSEFAVEIALNPVSVEGGVVVIASVVDITPRLEAARVTRERDERARQAQKLEALGRLAGGIAHDFNNILLGIVGYTELAQRQLREVPGARADLEQVLRAAERGRQLVSRILMFTHPRETPPAPLYLEKVVREATELLRASLPATIEMRLSVDPGLPAVLADETSVHQVILNLGTNSAHAMEEGGLLRVLLIAVEPGEAFRMEHPTFATGAHVRLSVIDNGTGMPPEVRARLFEPFFTTKAFGKGSGLGLASVRSLVQALGGEIEIQSQPGEGTRVDVWFPAAGAAAGGASSGAAPAPGPAQLHVLFVEDEPALAAMERRQLEALGFRVTLHTSSREALEDFRSRPDAFDLMVTDNTMPHMTGLVLARHVTAIRPGLPVLMVSGYADYAVSHVLAEHGIAEVLPKPHDLSELDQALRRLLRR